MSLLSHKMTQNNREMAISFSSDFVLAAILSRSHMSINCFYCWSAFGLLFKIDINIGHISDHIMAIIVVCSHKVFFKMAIIGHFTLNRYGYVYGQYWCIFKELSKCTLPVKTVYRNGPPNRYGGQKRNWNSRIGNFPCILSDFGTQRWHFGVTLFLWSSDLVILTAIIFNQE